jgi:hypothetical protein
MRQALWAFAGVLGCSHGAHSTLAEIMDAGLIAGDCTLAAGRGVSTTASSSSLSLDSEQIRSAAWGRASSLSAPPGIG